MPSLAKLRRKRHQRLEARKRHLRLYRKSHKTQKGFARAAARDGRAARKLAALIAKVIHAQKGTLAGVRIRSTASGAPHWGAAADIMGQFVTPFMLKRGLPKGSGKRTPAHNAAIGGSPTSDHLTTMVLKFARDFPTFSGEDDARALALAFGIHGWQPNSFETHRVVIDGYAFDIQILWGSGIDHGDHVHVGISLVGRA
jgi:hypothetical protein